MNRRSLFRSLIGLPLLPLAAKACPMPALDKDTIWAQLLDGTTVMYTYPSPIKWYSISCSGGGGASGGHGSGWHAGGGAGGVYSSDFGSVTVTVGGRGATA